MAPADASAPRVRLSSPTQRPDFADDVASYSHSGTISLSAFSPPIRSINPLLPLSIIHPTSANHPTVSTPRLIPLAHPLMPHPPSHFKQDQSPSDPACEMATRGSPATSRNGSLTVRPAILGSNQSTLKPLLPAPLSPWHMGGDTNGNGGGKTWQETDSRTARQPERPQWISSLGEVKMVDELEMEMCVLCGRAMGRSEVEVKEFELGGAAGLQTGSAGGRLTGATGMEEAGKEASVEGLMDGLALGVGRWMVCKDTGGCDAAVEDAVFADDEDE